MYVLVDRVSFFIHIDKITYLIIAFEIIVTIDISRLSWVQSSELVIPSWSNYPPIIENKINLPGSFDCNLEGILEC